MQIVLGFGGSLFSFVNAAHFFFDFVSPYVDTVAKNEYWSQRINVSFEVLKHLAFGYLAVRFFRRKRGLFTLFLAVFCLALMLLSMYVSYGGSFSSSVKVQEKDVAAIEAKWAQKEANARSDKQEYKKANWSEKDGVIYYSMQPGFDSLSTVLRNTITQGQNEVAKAEAYNTSLLSGKKIGKIDVQFNANAAIGCDIGKLINAFFGAWFWVTCAVQYGILTHKSKTKRLTWWQKITALVRKKKPHQKRTKSNDKDKKKEGSGSGSSRTKKTPKWSVGALRTVGVQMLQGDDISEINLPQKYIRDNHNKYYRRSKKQGDNCYETAGLLGALLDYLGEGAKHPDCVDYVSKNIPVL